MAAVAAGIVDFADFFGRMLETDVAAGIGFEFADSNGSADFAVGAGIYQCHLDLSPNQLSVLGDLRFLNHHFDPMANYFDQCLRCLNNFVHYCDSWCDGDSSDSGHLLDSCCFHDFHRRYCRCSLLRRADYCCCDSKSFHYFHY